MLQIDSLHFDGTRGFRIVFRVDTSDDVISLGHIVKGLVSSIPYPQQKIKPDEAFFETISTVIIDDALSGITRIVQCDDDNGDGLPLYFGVNDSKDIDILNSVYNAVHGFSGEKT